MVESLVPYVRVSDCLCCSCLYASCLVCQGHMASSRCLQDLVWHTVRCADPAVHVPVVQLTALPKPIIYGLSGSRDAGFA